jgi:hypothetical protein
MKKTELIKVLHGMARPLEYRRKGSLFWKTGNQLTTLIHLQSSRWGRGMYVNFGVTPNEMITKAAPPSVEYWARQKRGESCDSPFKDQFSRLVLDDEDAMRPEEMTEAFRWLLMWIEDHFGDADAMRKAIIDKNSDSWGILEDWAKGELKEPSYYFKDAPYYCKP